MFHKRCREIESILRDELEEARTRIAQLEEELDRRMLVPPKAGPEAKGNVYYMDDARMVELETDGA